MLLCFACFASVSHALHQENTHHPVSRRRACNPASSQPARQRRHSGPVDTAGRTSQRTHSHKASLIKDQSVQRGVHDVQHRRIRIINGEQHWVYKTVKTTNCFYETTWKTVSRPHVHINKEVCRWVVVPATTYAGGAAGAAAGTGVAPGAGTVVGGAAGSTAGAATGYLSCQLIPSVIYW